ncbi:MAG: metallophosphoesterase, partial [Lentisphaeria bacterium]|nr:metallophosphoesterase [Lentisphaeria bacterium]
VYVPGNHDAYVPNHACRNALDSAFDMLNSGQWTRASLPLETGIGALRLFLLDEAQPNSWIMSTGRVEKSDRSALRKLLEQPRAKRETRILISHFPAAKADGRQLGTRRQLEGGAWVRQLLRDGLIDAALCGHIHRPFARWEPNGTAEFCAGSLTLHGWLNVLDCCDEKGTLSQFWVDVRASTAKCQPAEANLSAAPA